MIVNYQAFLGIDLRSASAMEQEISCDVVACTIFCILYKGIQFKLLRALADTQDDYWSKEKSVKLEEWLC